MGHRKTIKKERFAFKYVECGNASEAYRFAYNATNMKPDSIKRVASELLKDLYVTSTVKELQNQLKTELKISAEKVLKEYARIAFFDIRTLFNEENSYKELSEIDTDSIAAIANIEIAESYGTSGESGVFIKKIKLNDKLKALDALARHLGFYNPESNRQKKLVIVKDFTGRKMS